MMQHLVKIAAASFIFWLMVLATLDVLNVIDLQVDAPFIIELLHNVPKALNIVNDANASSAELLTESIPAEMPLMKIKITILPDLT